MRVKIEAIEKVDLPNYLETVWSGDKSETKEAPLLAKYRVDIQYGDKREKLFFEVRKQPNGNPLIDEYYEDQVYEAIHRLISHIDSNKTKTRTYNNLIQLISALVFREWDGERNDYPKFISVNT